MNQRVGVIGAGAVGPEGRKLAHQVGKLLAQAGVTLVCGGLGGVMEAASQGCAEHDGLVVGILPGADATAANPYVHVPILTDMGHARNVIIAHTAQAFIAIDGGYGTASEAAIALKLGKQVVGLGAVPAIEGVQSVASAEEAVRLTLYAVKGEGNEG